MIGEPTGVSKPIFSVRKFFAIVGQDGQEGGFAIRAWVGLSSWSAGLQVCWSAGLALNEC